MCTFFHNFLSWSDVYEVVSKMVLGVETFCEKQRRICSNCHLVEERFL